MKKKLHTLLSGCIIGLMMGLSACSSEVAQTAKASDSPSQAEPVTPASAPEVMEVKRRPNVSQQFVGIDLVSLRLAKALDELPYEVQTLDEYAQSVNKATWSPPVEGGALDEAVVMRIQALLNWHHHSVGAVDGKMSKNTIKAMKIFQQRQGLTVTETMDLPTWQALFADSELNSQPVLVRYKLTDDDVRLHGGRSGYRSVSEAVAEKFHMSQALLKSLNPQTPLKAGNTITVYNPYQPNEVSVAKVVVKRKENILYAYDKDDKLVASYPTTINQARTPKGAYKVANRVIDPAYNKDFRNKNGVVPPGPNNPVGRVWIGINKPSFGIHGSPEPERISRQTSAGCVRLTNWDALGLYGAIEEGAAVEFI